MSSEFTPNQTQAFTPEKSHPEILGPYRIVKPLGEGGMGCVYLATDEQLQRTVALKVLRPVFAVDEEAHARFFREARAAAGLNHDNIVTIYQVGEDQGTPFLAMEHLEGKSLEEWLRPDRRATLTQTISIGKQIGRGLSAAHAAGMIHRDIKPANIWLEPNGRIKILDFGIAQHATASNTKLTHTGAVIGTPAFMSPEQARGEQVDHRTDLFSFGCVLYRMVTGRLPFQAEGVYGVIAAIISESQIPAITLNPAVPKPLSEFIDHLLSKSRDDRPNTAQEALKQLKEIESQPTQGLTGDPTVSLPDIPTVRVADDAQPPWKKWGIWALPLLVLLLGTVIWFVLRDTNTPRQTAASQENESEEPPSPKRSTDPSQRTDDQDDTGESDEAIDLLAAVDVHKPLRGIWIRSGDTIVGRQPISKPRPMASFAIEIPVPHPIPEEYCLEIRVERVTNETGPFLMKLTAQSNPLVVGIDATYPERKGVFTGILFQRLHRRGGILTPRIPVNLAFWVKRNQLRVTANDKEIYSWTGDFSELQAPPRSEGDFTIAGRHPVVFRVSKVRMIPYPDQSTNN